MKNFGWIIQDKVSKKYYGSQDGSFCLSSFRDAEVNTRYRARLLHGKQEIVHKVKLTEDGKPKKIIERG